MLGSVTATIRGCRFNGIQRSTRFATLRTKFLKANDMMKIHCSTADKMTNCNAYTGLHSVVHSVDRKEFRKMNEDSQYRYFLCKRCLALLLKKRSSKRRRSSPKKEQSNVRKADVARRAKRRTE